MALHLDDIEIAFATAADTWQVRQKVLRPNLPIETAKFVEDAMPSAIHVVARLGAEVVGVASIYCQPEDLSTGAPNGKIWRLRGMATTDEVRSKGVGSKILEKTFRAVKDQGGTRLWCNARKAAVPFYQRHGFKIYGDIFEIPGAGPHYVMKREFT